MILQKLMLVFSLFIIAMSCNQKIYNVVDVQPEYPNGMAALFQYLGKNISYPQICRDNGIEGSIYMGFVIEKNGMISNVVCKRGNFCEGYTQSVIKTIQSMPKWKPGLVKGKPVRVSYTIPIKIHLE
jgi:periplasmic protein TonB